MLSLILGWLAPLVPGLAKSAIDAYSKKLDSENTAEKIAADLAAKQADIDLQRQQLEQAVLTSEEGKWGPWVRWGFAFPFVLFNAKAIVWDRMLHMGYTDQLSPELLALEQIVIAAYFGHSAITIVGRAVARRP